MWPKNIKKNKNKNALYLSVNVFSTKVLFGDTIFYVSNWRRDRHFTWSSEPREGLACCSEKGVPSFLSFFQDPEYWSGPRNRTRHLPLCSQHTLPTELTLLRLSCRYLGELVRSPLIRARQREMICLYIYPYCHNTNYS